MGERVFVFLFLRRGGWDEGVREERFCLFLPGETRQRPGDDGQTIAASTRRALDTLREREGGGRREK